MTTTSKIFAYVRVSTKDQNTGRQIEALKPYVNNEADIFIDKLSGKDFNRPQYQLLSSMVRKGDQIYIKSLDRLGRNKVDVKRELQTFKDKGVMIRCLDIPTTLMDWSSFGDFQQAIFDMVNNILIEVLGTIAEQERKTTRQRQQEGIEIAKAEGRPLGRPKADYPPNWKQTYESWKQGQITAKVAMDTMAMKRTTFYKLVKTYE